MTLPLHLKKDIEEILKKDKFFKKQKVEMPDFSWRKTDDSFSSLARIILAQQVSTAVANNLWQRLLRNCNGKISPKKIMRRDDEVLRSLGLSRQKISYLRTLSEAIEQGQFDPEGLKNLDDEGVVKRLTEMKGFGIWSAQMFLIFTLARPDIWPAQDLMIRDGVGRYLGLSERPDVDSVVKFGESFKGKRTSLALLLWGIKKEKS